MAKEMPLTNCIKGDKKNPYIEQNYRKYQISKQKK